MTASRFPWFDAQPKCPHVHPHTGQRCCNPVGHVGCCAAWTADTPKGKCDVRWWPRPTADKAA